MQVKRKAFTLVELLVSMAILGILIGILVPALGGAVLASKRTQCLMSLRSLGLGLQMYMDQENDGIFPLVPGFSRQRPDSGFERVYKVLEEYIDSPLPVQEASGVFPHRQPFACPLDDRLADEYGYSYDFFPGRFMTVPGKPHLVMPGTQRETTRMYEMGIVTKILFMDAREEWHPGGPNHPPHLDHFDGKNAYHWDGSVGWVKLSDYRGT